MRFVSVDLPRSGKQREGKQWPEKERERLLISLSKIGRKKFTTLRNIS